MAFVALYDACVLHPEPLRSLLVQLAQTKLFRARWTEDIHQEWMRSVTRLRPHVGPDKLRRVADLMNLAVEDCLVDGHGPLASMLTLPDPDDRHVLAAAIVGRADVIVTSNLRHFPKTILEPLRIEAQHPDVFIRHVLDLDIQAVTAVRLVRARMRNPAMEPAEYLDMLLRQGLPDTVAFLREIVGAL